jgi:small subunit ribosomal protein S1
MNTTPESTDITPDESPRPEESETSAPDSSEEITKAKPAATVKETEASEAVQPADEPPVEPPAEAIVEVTAESAEVQAEATAVETEATEVTMAEPAAEPDSEATTQEVVGKEVAEAIASDTRLEHKLKKGQRVEVKLIQVNEKDAFLDWGGPSDGTIASAELKDKEGKLRVNEGESFTVIVREIGDIVVFTVGRGKGGDMLRMRELESAHEARIPVPGKIRSMNKGGFEVDLGGVRAFCPFSQIDTIYCDNPETHLGSEYPFEIVTFERGGRNIVVSRRGLLEVDQKAKGAVTREKLEVGAVLEGKVRRIQPYGAFIDIGGLDGLVHVSEISRAHIRSPKDVLKVGQKVDVKVVGLDALGTKKERVSLSIKALAPDPWDGAADRWKVGTTVQGRVVRLTDFGAFVELAPGIDGLVHISQISSERIGHPNEVLKPNQEVEVRVIELDSESHRISLTMRPEGEESAHRGGGGGRGGSRRPYQERAPMEYSSSVEEPEEKNVDVSGMGYEDALAELRKKFGH